MPKTTPPPPPPLTMLSTGTALQQQQQQQQRLGRGGAVCDPLTGLHYSGPGMGLELSFDFSSMYPSIMCALNISPETTIPWPPTEFPHDLSGWVCYNWEAEGFEYASLILKYDHTPNAALSALRPCSPPRSSIFSTSEPSSRGNSRSRTSARQSGSTIRLRRLSVRCWPTPSTVYSSPSVRSSHIWPR